MKTYLFGLLTGLLLVAAGVIWYSKTRPPKEPETVIQVVENNVKVDSLKWEIQTLNKLLDSAGKVIQRRDGKIITQRREIATLKAFKDSAQLAYEREKTLERCDSLVTAQNGVIQAQDSLINELDLEAREYSKQAYLLTHKTELQSIIIQAQDSTIKQLNCAATWKVKHRFWAWVMGWKCYPP